MLEWLAARQLLYVLVGNKIDQVKSSQQAAQQKRIAQALRVPVTEIRWVSATHGAGVKALRKEVVQFLNTDQYGQVD